MISINELNLVLVGTYVQLMNNKSSYEISELFTIASDLRNTVPDVYIDIDDINVYGWIEYFCSLGYYEVHNNTIVFNEKSHKLLELVERLISRSPKNIMDCFYSASSKFSNGFANKNSRELK